MPSAQEKGRSGRRPPFIEDLLPGMEARLEHRVEKADLADAFGNTGVKVLGTPALIGWLEQTASGLIRPKLPPGTLTVGISINIRHLAAAARGSKVMTTGRILEVDGRRVVFEVEARDEIEKLAEGTHERFIVDEDGFLARSSEKTSYRDKHSRGGWRGDAPVPETRVP